MDGSTRLDDTVVPLSEVLTTAELDRRPSRSPDFEAENRALVALAGELASSPETLLQSLVETALELCRAESTGMSILETGEGRGRFRWNAMAGLFASHLGETISRDGSPCGTVLDRDAALLMERPARHYTELRGAQPEPVEVLLVPFHVAGEPVGTVWAVGHSDDCRFDAEDARLLRSLSRFAGTGYQLLTALRTAEQANEAKSQFLAVMSHELRTPLTGAIGYADLLEAEVAGPTSPEQNALLERIKSNAWQLVAIIDEILTFSRSEAGKELVRLADCDLLETVREVVEVVRSAADRKGLTLRLAAPGQPVPVRTDPGKVRRILLDLLGNAIKYTDRGGATVSVDTAADDRLSIHIRDTGPGIPPDERERIFEAFTQLDGGKTRARGGVGLGLAVCRKLARLLGGDIAVESRVGEGSTFTLRLPRRGRALSAAAQPPA